MTSGPSDTDAGARPARKPKPVRPARPVQPKPARPKAVRPKPAGRKPLAPKPVTARPARPRANGPRKAPAARPQPIAANDPLIGKTIGRCRIEALVGVGRTARVYRAYYEALDDTVAIKILRNEVAENPLLVERFQSEARAIAKVDNENVLKIYDVGKTDDGLYYMVVELLEGEEIFEVIQREGQVEPMDALRIIRQAANGLGAAHAHHLVHRDVKPQNLFLLEDGTVKVVDFGLAAGLDDKSERVGTPHYMAPEVCEQAKAETASDIYGLGITLFHLLTGQPPYAGKDIKQILKAHMLAQPLHPERRMRGLPRPIGDLVRDLTKRDPLMRPTAPEVVEKLDAFGGKELKQKDTLKKRRTRSRARSAVARRARKGKGTPAVAAIAGGLLVVGVVALIAMGGGGSRDGDGAAERPDGPQPASNISDRPAPSVPAEAPAAKQAREEAAAARAYVAEGRDALERAEQWAREHWHGPADTDAVISKYRYVQDKWKGLPPGEEAKQRIRDIKRKKLHPHPDRRWTSADELAEAKAAWQAARPRVEEKIAAHDYAAAKALVPARVSDESGSLSRELDFWRTHTAHLVDWRKAVRREVPNLPLDERGVQTPDGEGTLQRFLSDDEMSVKVGGRTRTYTWSALGAEALADLAMNAFSGKSADLLLLHVAFTYAHKLKDAFWDAQIEFGVTPGAGVHERMNKIYKEKMREWAEAQEK